MTAPAIAALARITIAAPYRRLDVALPDDVPLAELLPHLLSHTGESVADDGERHGGWALYPATGGALNTARSLGAQGVRDGDVLHLRSGRSEWPELDYDDVVEAIASGARRYGRSWGNVATRRATLVMVAVLAALGLPVLAAGDPPWAVPGLVGLGMAVLLLAAGGTLARALHDALSGAVVAGCALPYALLGGLLVAAPPVPAGELGAPHVLLGSAALLVASTAGYVAVAELARVFVAGVATGFFGLIAGVLGVLGLDAAAAAGVALTAAVILLPAYPHVGLRVGKLPVPELPQKAEDLLNDQPVPDRATVFSAVARSDEIVTGLLVGVGVVSAAAAVTLMLSGRVVAVLLVAEGATALLLRSRLFPTPRQRIPLLAGGLVAAGLLVVGFALAGGNARRELEVLVLAVATGLVLSAGLVYSRRAPSPYLGRLADIVDVVSILSLVPTAFALAGFFRYVQASLAGVGG